MCDSLGTFVKIFPTMVSIGPRSRVTPWIVSWMPPIAQKSQYQVNTILEYHRSDRKMWLHAIWDIRAGCELLFPYGPDFGETHTEEVSLYRERCKKVTINCTRFCSEEDSAKIGNEISIACTSMAANSLEIFLSDAAICLAINEACLKTYHRVIGCFLRQQLVILERRKSSSDSSLANLLVFFALQELEVIADRHRSIMFRSQFTAVLMKKHCW